MRDYFPWNTELNLFWKRKLRAMRYKSRPLLFIKDRYCDICHRYEQVYPVNDVLLCKRCADGVMTKDAFVLRIPNFINKRKCVRCNKIPPLYIYKFSNINACLKCMWYILAKKRSRMTHLGDRII
jgi:hypothetical protein